MAKAKSGSSKKIMIIFGVVLLFVVALIITSTVITTGRANAQASEQSTFYVDVNGIRYYKGGEIRLKRNSITTFQCGYTAGGQNSDKLYNVKITSTSTDETAFTYTLNGAKRMFLDGEDYTDCFDVTENASTFEIAHENDTPATILQRRFAGKTVNAPTTDPTISYFTLTVSSADGSQSLSFALTFENLKMNVNPGNITF